jgi:cholest-4-en-3-one 26-monooxygenase
VTTTSPAGLDDVDLWDLDQFVDGSVADVFRRLRAEAPVWWHDRPGGEPFWAVTRMEHARTVFRDPMTFSSQANGVMVRDAETLGRMNPAQALGIHPMIHTDPPRHVQLRKLVSRRFTPRSIAELESEIRRYAVDCVRGAVRRGTVDFVTDIAHRIPAAITFALLDVPEHEWDRLAELEHRTIARSDPEFVDGVSVAESAAAAGAEIFGYFAELVQARLDHPGDDLLSQFIRGRIDGEKLPWEQVVAEAGLLLAGGLDTTRAAASAGAMLPLLRDRAQFDALWSDVRILDTGVEEFVRWASPIVSEMRTATRDVELAGQTIRAGERLVVWGASCNRDERAFEEPDRFDLRRDPNPHIGFSFGEHFCLGAHLARLTLRVEFETLVEHVADVELVGEPVRVRSNFVGGLKHLPVRLVPR